MKISTLLYICLACLALMLFPSCDDELDIQPRQGLESDQVFTSPSNLEAALNGAYSEIKGAFGASFAGELYGGDFNIMSELLSADSNVIWGGSFNTYQEIFGKDITITNGVVNRNWLRAYQAINNINNVLANLDVAADQNQRDRVEGEARTMRGMMYFNLVRFWSRPWGTGTENTDPGVPLVLEPVTTVEDAERTANLGRSTVAEVYAQVLDDLTTAENLLKSFGGNSTGISTHTAAAILSRVYLQQGRYREAAEAASRVIESGLYSLNGNPLSAFNNSANTSEDVFAIQQTALSNAGMSNAGLATFYASLNGAGRGDIQVQEPHLRIFEAGDLRGGLQTDLPQSATIVNVSEFYYIGVGAQNSGQIQCAKYGEPTLNIPVIRLAEMYLTRAEGNLEADTTTGAAPADDINVVRQRAGLSPVGSPTRQDIRLERQRELAFEGFRLHDFKRWQLTTGGLPWDAPSLILPIPERELEAYDIQQNEGY